MDANILHYFLKNYGFKTLKRRGGLISKYREGFYELASEKGITEIHLLVPPNEKSVKDIHVRFSVISPPSVINQTFEFFKVLKEKFNLEVQDTEVGNHIWLNKTKLEDRKMTDLINNIPDEETFEKNAKKDVIPIDINEFKKNKLGIRKRKLVLLDHPKKKPIRCEDTLKNMGKGDLIPLMHLD
ncbi:MAG: hypothetical protein KKH40_01945 [Nanoarchaeota archaeon]|nr:hypothetical protein [Nanoarchaeota archaeon]